MSFMFSSKTSVLFITPMMLQLYEVVQGRSTTSTLVHAIETKGRAFAEVMSELSEVLLALGHETRLLVSDTWIYVTALRNEPAPAKTLEEVIEKAHSFFPESLSETLWDYGLVQDHEGRHILEIAAVVKRFNDRLQKITEATGIEFTSIEPVSLALARQLVDEPPYLLIYQSKEEQLCVLGEGETVWASRQATESISEQLLRSLLEYAASQRVKVIQILVHTSREQLPTQFLGLPLTKVLLDPVASTALRQTRKPSDPQSIFLQPAQLAANQASSLLSSLTRFFKR